MNCSEEESMRRRSVRIGIQNIEACPTLQQYKASPKETISIENVRNER